MTEQITHSFSPCSVDFSPDAWQRDVLDKIDADESILIVAPTSSGKTFISFAAMERVLRESDEGVGTLTLSYTRKNGTN